MNQGAGAASSWGQSHESGTHQMADVLAFQSHDPGTVKPARHQARPNRCVGDAERPLTAGLAQAAPGWAPRGP
jgi:hypothetical protein